MMLCVIGLPFNFVFSFMKNVSHLSYIHACPCCSIGAIVITFVQEKYSEAILKKTCK